MLEATIITACALVLIVLLVILLRYGEDIGNPNRAYWDAIYTAHAEAFLSGPPGRPTRPLPPMPTRLVKAPEGARVDPLRLWSMYGPFI